MKQSEIVIVYFIYARV